MLANNKKLSENVHNISRTGTLVHGRRFHHAHVQTPAVKTAAQRKEYPPNIQKIDNACMRFSRLPDMQSVAENREESGSESDLGITRKVQLKRHCNLHQSGLLPSPATKKCATHLEGLEQSHYSTVCPCNMNANESQNKCQVCGSSYLEGFRRQSMQTVVPNDSLGPLARESIHETSAGQKSLTPGLNAKKFYGSPPGTVSVDFMVRRDPGPIMLRPNGKVGSKITGKLRQKSPTASGLNDPIVLSSDDEEEEEEIGSANRIESISPRPADSACSSPAPSTGKVEAALKENTCGIEQRLTSITADTEPAITLPRKARMKDQFGNVVATAPVKRRKVLSQENTTDVVVAVKYQNPESVILNCRSIRIGTLRRMVVEPVIVSVNTMGHAVSESKMQLRNATQFQFFDDDDEESGEPHTVFIGPIEKLIVYPPPPSKGGISVTNEDLHCLNEGEFLNDVIIDFYLKYLVLEKLKKEDADRIHVFSSFFYKRLNQRERRNLHETSKLTIQQKRHGRVKTWTRHVDIFEKDFIFVPLNEAAHWFLAIICFPGLEKPIYESNPYYQEHIPNIHTLVKSASSDQERNTSPPTSSELDPLQHSSATPLQHSAAKKMLNKKPIAALTDIGAEVEETESLFCRRNSSGKSGFKKLNQLNSTTEELQTVEFVCHKHAHRTSEANGLQSEHLTRIQATDGLQKIRLNYSEDSADSSKLNEDELIDFSEDQDNQDSSDDDGLADDDCNSELGQWHLRPTVCKQYLEVEWEVRKGSKRSFSKDVMKGSNPKVPQQNNFSDCGVYVLQYVESFFETPILSFELPMNLTDWFPRPRMKTKREEIRNIILNLQGQQNKEKKAQKDFNSTERSLQGGLEQLINSSSD
ncbi:hypothetical protein lerEdw1_001311 [Lerista edwardsae]|nr:hypothetical protein lerEdw1_001311 [Lerista edwardsae]